MGLAAETAGTSVPRVYAVVDRDTERLLRALPDVEVAGAERSARALIHAERLPGDAGAVVVSDRAGDTVAALAAALARWAPYVPVVLLASTGARLLDMHAEYLAAAACDPRADPRARVHVVQGPLDGKRLGRALRRHVPLNGPSAGHAVTSEPSNTGTDPARARYAALRRSGAVTVLVHGCAGGAGSSTVATLVAGAIARRQSDQRICVVELGAARPDHNDADIEELAARGPVHMPALGVSILTGVAIEAAGGVAGQRTARLLRALHRRFDVVVVDANAAAGADPALADAANVVLLVTTLVATSLRGLEHRAPLLAGVAPHAGERWGGVVVNGPLNGVGVDPPQVIAAAHGAPIVAAVPHAARDVAIAVNAGRIDALLDHPDLGPVYAHLAERCTPGSREHEAPAARPRRRRLVRRRARSAPAGVASPFLLDSGHESAAG